MKKILTFITTLYAFSVAQAQHRCCSVAGSTETFAMLTQDQKFIDTHLDPYPFNLENKIGHEISFKTNDGKLGHAHEIKANTATKNFVFVIHEWCGLNDYTNVIYKLYQ